MFVVRRGTGVATRSTVANERQSAIIAQLCETFVGLLMTRLKARQNCRKQN